MNYQQFTNQTPHSNRQNYPQLQKYPYFATPSVNHRPQLATHFQPPTLYYPNPQIYAQNTPVYQHQANPFVSVQTYPTPVSTEYYQAPMQLSYAPVRHQLPQNSSSSFEIEDKTSAENLKTTLQDDSTRSIEEIKKARKFGTLSCASTFMAVVYSVLALMQLFGHSIFRVDLFTDYDPSIQQAIYLSIFVLMTLKIGIFASGNLAVKNKSLSMTGVFISGMIAHILFVTFSLFVVATFCPWIFNGVVLIYIMTSFLETMWFLPFAFAFKAYLETLQMTKSAVSA